MVILAGLAFGGVAYYQWSVQIPALVQQRNTEQMARQRELAAHLETKQHLKETVVDLNRHQQELAGVKLEQQKALARVDLQEKRAGDLQTKLAKVDAHLQDSQNFLAEYKASGLNPEEVATLVHRFMASERQLAAVTIKRDEYLSEYRTVAQRLSKYTDLEPAQFPSDLKGSVVSVDPKWNFVVLDIGEKRAIQEGEMLVSRHGKLVAKVVIVSVQKDRCIADLVPHWKFGEVMEGDTVTPAHPAGSMEIGLTW